jgi:hypothetical protein
LVHVNDANLSFKDLLEIHVDWETDLSWNYLTCAWEIFVDDCTIATSHQDEDGKSQEVGA